MCPRVSNGTTASQHPQTPQALGARDETRQSMSHKCTYEARDALQVSWAEEAAHPSGSPSGREEAGLGWAILDGPSQNYWTGDLPGDLQLILYD